MAAGQIKPDVVYDNAQVLAFRDVNPQAPTHILIIPKAHIASMNELTPDQGPLIGAMYLAAKTIAQQEGVAERGYRLVLNTNRDAGQSVFHLHLHLLAGRALNWPPG
jgi:histidine triad (HIT) family protein